MDQTSVTKILTDFKASSDDQMWYVIPLTSKERKQFHDLCDAQGLFSETTPDKKRMLITKVKQPITITISAEDRDQFARDYNLPIAVTKNEKIFEYLIDLLDDMLGTRHKYQIFTKSLIQLKTEGTTLKKCFITVSDKFVSTIKSTDAYKRFVEKDNSNQQLELPPNAHIWNIHDFVEAIVTGELDTGEPVFIPKKKCDAKCYISLDQKQANFSAMKFFDPELVLGCNTYEELIGKFTDNQYIIQSKHLRQILFGHLKGHRISSIQKHLQSHLYNLLKNSVKVAGQMSSDEFIVETTKETMKQDFELITNVVSNLPENMRNIWRVTPFMVIPLNFEVKCNTFVKHTIVDIDDLTKTKPELKCVGKELYACAYKTFKGLPITELDRKAMLGNMIVTIDEGEINL